MATYNEWINNPDEIMMYLSSITIKQFSESAINSRVTVDSNFNLNGYDDSNLFPDRNSDGDSNVKYGIGRANNKLTINIKWGKKPLSTGNKKLIPQKQINLLNL